MVIDKRQNRIPPQIFGGEGSGYGSTLAALPQRYPWLSAMADREVNGETRSAGMSVSVRAGTPGPMTFVGSFPGAGLTAEDLMVVLIFTGPANQTYWAKRLVG